MLRKEDKENEMLINDDLDTAVPAEMTQTLRKDNMYNIFDNEQ